MSRPVMLVDADDAFFLGPIDDFRDFGNGGARVEAGKGTNVPVNDGGVKVGVRVELGGKMGGDFMV
jgi:hypothetical protein